MDMGCVALTFIVLTQMIIVLAMLNPVYDVRKIITSINNRTSDHKNIYYAIVVLYFSSVVIFGMYYPLQNMYSMIFSDELDAHNKLVLLARVEKNYIVAGFSLFLVVVLYGVRALLSYTANLLQIVEKTSESVLSRTTSEKMAFNDQTILPNLLRVKRSISYEAVLCNNEPKDRFKILVKNFNYHQNKNVFSSIFETATSDRVNF